MTTKHAKALEDAKAAIITNRERAPYLSNWRHLKSGGEYAVQMHVIIEETLEPGVVYYKRHSDPALTWCRPASEFFGRFERIHSHAPAAAEVDTEAASSQ